MLFQVQKSTNVDPVVSLEGNSSYPKLRYPKVPPRFFKVSKHLVDTVFTTESDILDI